MKNKLGPSHKFAFCFSNMLQSQPEHKGQEHLPQRSSDTFCSRLKIWGQRLKCFLLASILSWSEMALLFIYMWRKQELCVLEQNRDKPHLKIISTHCQVPSALSLSPAAWRCVWNSAVTPAAEQQSTQEKSHCMNLEEAPATQK